MTMLFSFKDIKSQPKMKRSRRNRKMKTSDPFWLKGVQWTERTKNLYRVPQEHAQNVIKSDRDLLNAQAEQSLLVQQLRELVDETSSADCSMVMFVEESLK